MTSDESGDGDGIFYTTGGDIMPQDILEECQEFSEEVMMMILDGIYKKKLTTVQCLIPFWSLKHLNIKLFVYCLMLDYCMDSIAATLAFKQVLPEQISGN